MSANDVGLREVFRGRLRLALASRAAMSAQTFSELALYARCLLRVREAELSRCA